MSSSIQSKLIYVGVHQYMEFDISFYAHFFTFLLYFRMSLDAFDHLPNLLQPLIQKQNTTFQQAINVKERLAVTLPYLASSDSQQTHSWSYLIGKATIFKLIKRTTNAIWEVLHDIYLKPTQEMENRIAISDEFGKLWNFPNCIRAINEKHVVIECPKLSTLITKDFLVSFCSQFTMQNIASPMLALVNMKAPMTAVSLEVLVYIRLLRKTISAYQLLWKLKPLKIHYPTISLVMKYFRLSLGL